MESTRRGPVAIDRLTETERALLGERTNAMKNTGAAAESGEGSPERRDEGTARQLDYHFFWGLKYVSNVRDFTLITSFFYPSCRVVHLARRRSCRVELLENYARELTISGASMNLTAPTPKPSWS
jgi:hypothetical protein